MATPVNDDPFLRELLRTGIAPASPTDKQPISERDLLRAANAAGTPVLSTEGAFSNPSSSQLSVGYEVRNIIERYPFPAVGAAVVLGYILSRRRT